LSIWLSGTRSGFAFAAAFVLDFDALLVFFVLDMT
jgi:hypothetical protein